VNAKENHLEIPAASEEGCKFPDQFVAEAIRKKLRRERNGQRKDDGIDALEQTHMRVRALLELLSDKFDTLSRDGGCDPSGNDLRPFYHGVDLLIAKAQDELCESFETVFDFSRPDSAPSDAPKG
jgi:hypothetical protein